MHITTHNRHQVGQNFHNIIIPFIPSNTSIQYTLNKVVLDNNRASYLPQNNTYKKKNLCSLVMLQTYDRLCCICKSSTTLQQDQSEIDMNDSKTWNFPAQTLECVGATRFNPKNWVTTYSLSPKILSAQTLDIFLGLLLFKSQHWVFLWGQTSTQASLHLVGPFLIGFAH